MFLQKNTILSDFHGFFVVVSEEVVGLVRLHRLPSIDAKVKHCVRGEGRQSMNKVVNVRTCQTSSSGCVPNTWKTILKKKTNITSLAGVEHTLRSNNLFFTGLIKTLITDQSL